MGIFGNKKEEEPKVVKVLVELKCPHCDGTIKETTDDDEPSILEVQVGGGDYYIFAHACPHCKKVLGITGEL